MFECWNSWKAQAKSFRWNPLESESRRNDYGSFLTHESVYPNYTRGEMCLFVEMLILTWVSSDGFQKIFPFKATPVGGWVRRCDNTTIETSRHCDMCFDSPAFIQKSPLRLLNHHFSLHSLSLRLRFRGRRLSCYVFVCFGNGFQVAIVVYVTWWLMGKIHLLLTPPASPPKATLVCPSRMNTQWEEQVPSYSPDKVTHWHPDARFFAPAGRCL